MPTYYEITFLPEGRVEDFFGSRGNYYRLPDGSELDVRTVPAWCRRCGGLTDAEKVEPLAAIDRELADLADPTSDLYRWTVDVPPSCGDDAGGALRLERVETLMLRRRWREGRASPPKCIHCGSADVVIFPLDEPVPHPSGSGTVTVRVVGLCSTRWNDWYFTPEGERIPMAAPVVARGSERVSERVSVWLGTARSAAELAAYLSDPQGFESDFGFRTHSADHVRTVVVPEGDPPEPVADLLTGLPGASGFTEAAATEAGRRLGWFRATAAAVLYDLEYDPEYDRAAGGSPMRFIGVFADGGPG